MLELREVLGQVHERLFRLSGTKADVAAALTAWASLPGILARLEDGMREAGVPLLARDMPR